MKLQMMIAAAVMAMTTAASADLTCGVLGPDEKGEITKVLAQKEINLGTESAAMVYETAASKILIGKNETGLLTLIETNAGGTDWNTLVMADGKQIAMGLKSAQLLIICIQK